MSLEAHIWALARFASGHAPPSSLAVLMQDGADPGQRALVYCNSGVAACVDALQSNFPGLAGWLGETRFRALARAFAAARPPEVRTLVGWGADLADWMEADARVIGEPWLADLARLDHAWLSAHLAANADPISAKDLAAGSTDLLQLRVRLPPSVAIVGVGFVLHDSWFAFRNGDATAPSPPEAGPETVLVWRPGDEVLSRGLDEASAAFLTLLAEPVLLGDAAAKFLSDRPDADLSRIFSDVLSSGLLTLAAD